MDVEQADLLRNIDPAVLGRRLRAARQASGLTQIDLAGSEVSVGYVSRIESGHRRPNGKVLDELAARVGVPVDQLLRGVSGRDVDHVRVTLDYAELSLETGQAVEAEAQAREALALVEGSSLTDMVHRGHLLLARALEARGEIDDAILELEPLADASTSGVLGIKAGIALCRCYRESGDFAMAIETGERVLAWLAGTPLDSTDEAVQLAVTLAAAYNERGDAGQAIRVCRRAVAKAETLSTSTARASAYWNASMFEAERGCYRDAVPLAQQALALLGEGQDDRNLARLRNAFGTMLLEMDPPAVDEAQAVLKRAAEDLPWCSAGPVDVAINNLALARATFLCGDLAEAQRQSGAVYDAMQLLAPATAAEAKALEGQVAAARDQLDEAVSCYRQAVGTLTGIGADHSAAQLWFELAGLCEDVGAFDLARDAYRSAGASTGLRTRPVSRSPLGARRVRQDA